MMDKNESIEFHFSENFPHDDVLKNLAELILCGFVCGEEKALEVATELDKMSQLV